MIDQAKTKRFEHDAGHGTTEFVPAHMAFDTATFAISPEYLQLAGATLLAGHNFTLHDEARSPLVAIVNETFAQKSFGTGSAVGQHFSMWQGARYEVVGVVAHGRCETLIEAPRPMMLVPFAQGVGGTPSTSVTVLVRSRLPENQTVAARSQFILQGFCVSRKPRPLNAFAVLVHRALVRFAGRIAVSALNHVSARSWLFSLCTVSESMRGKISGTRLSLLHASGMKLVSHLSCACLR